LFAAGLVLAGMTQPENILHFLDFGANWDPTLLFVMAGAILVHAPLLWWTRRRKQPVLASTFAIPSNSRIDAPLLVGSALFGTGWGLAGYCPGPAWVSLASGTLAPLVFVPSMFLGMRAFAAYERRLKSMKGCCKQSLPAAV
jgi:uncharacterized membrane protein YedE/YeeE